LLSLATVSDDISKRYHQCMEYSRQSRASTDDYVAPDGHVVTHRIIKACEADKRAHRMTLYDWQKQQMFLAAKLKAAA
jgi:hypothetical protein